jgi:hypothetical protein
VRTKLEKSSLFSEATSSSLQAKAEEEEEEEEEFLTPASSPEICPEPVFTFGSPAAAAASAAERKVSRLEATSVPGVGGRPRNFVIRGFLKFISFAKFLI